MRIGDRLKAAWYVLHTRSRFETVVHEQLGRKEIETFHPLINVPSRRKDRRVVLRAPLFPGYLFVKSDLHPQRHLEILKTVGAVKLIGNQGGPVPVPDEDIASLKIMVATDGDLLTGTRFKPGDRVMITQGPFAGVLGIFSEMRGAERVIVNIDVMGRFAAVAVNRDDVVIVQG